MKVQVSASLCSYFPLLHSFIDCRELTTLAPFEDTFSNGLLKLKGGSVSRLLTSAAKVA